MIDPDYVERCRREQRKPTIETGITWFRSPMLYRFVRELKAPQMDLHRWSFPWGEILGVGHSMGTGRRYWALCHAAGLDGIDDPGLDCGLLVDPRCIAPDCISGLADLTAPVSVESRMAALHYRDEALTYWKCHA